LDAQGSHMDEIGNSGVIGGDVKRELGLAPGGDPERHPTIDNVNALLAERLSPTEHICRRIAALTGAPAALVAAIVLQFVWIGIGLVTRWDPYPFVFLLTCSNVIQLILIFVIAVAQRQLSLHDELRAEADHGAISRLLYHQQTQELLLIRLAERLDVNTRDLMPMLTTLAGREERNSSGNGLHASPGDIE
jgi:uncharacterized membrane protein